MERIDLKQILLNFLDENDSKSILIDGPWGCGKTYETKEFIKSSKKVKIYYLSLFGLESIDEINTALYEQTKKRTKIIKHGALLISKAIKVFPVIPDISEALEYQIGSTSSLKVKKKSIIVFDDLERLSKEINYIDLMGYINSLYLSGCRVICLISSKNIEESRRKEFFEFKEKVFDRVYQIPGFNEKIVNEIFADLQLPDIFEIYDVFDNNIRLVQKTKVFYKKVKDRIDASDRKHIDFSDLSILKACAVTINISLKLYEYSPVKNDFIYEDYKKMYGEELAGNISYFYYLMEYKKIPRFMDVVISLISAFNYQDYNLFDEIFFIPEVNSTLIAEKEDDIFDNEFYYLSDEHKQDYINQFIKLISSDFTWTNKHTTILTSILIYSSYIFSDNQIEKIVKLTKGIDGFDENFRTKLGLSGKEEYKKCEYFINKMISSRNHFKNNELISQFSKYVSEKDYNNMIIAVGRYGKYESDVKNGFLNYLVGNSFFLPDISGDIDHDSWSYCHAIAKFANENGKIDEFLAALKNMHNGSKTESELDRCNALVHYNFGRDLSPDELEMM
ncbi:hypothetical protein DYE49_03815 [Treponema rectale]|uniref:KAP NTPase domain-containing protein n=1 Tax=Treponema rectale TaxID=744512 RepID=A0A7M1XLE9_9SPIR|nr:hypothetical protein DYE49_03815 [Treponema rectale]